MKIAYLMVVHSNPKLQKRAIEMLSSEGCAFFIHVDLKSDIRQFSGIAGDHVTFAEPRMPVHWGEFSQVQATMLLIRQVLNCSARYDYLVLLQGADYPLHSGTYNQAFFAENRGLEFISMARMPAPGFPLSKINRIRYPSEKPLSRFAARTMGKLGLAERDYRKHLGGLQPYAGDACWALSREACQYLVEFAVRVIHTWRSTSKTHSQATRCFFTRFSVTRPFDPAPGESLLYRDYPPTLSHPALLTEKHVEFFEAQKRVWVEDDWGAERCFSRESSRIRP